jgi:predicted NBD/HSP70 family sugar kinase
LNRIDNASEILRVLHISGPTSRSDLAMHIGLNRSTIGSHVQDLTEAGFVTEDQGRSGSVGRPSRVVSPLPMGAVVLAFDLRVEELITAVVGLGGHILTRRVTPHERTQLTVRAACALIAQQAHEVIQELGIAPARVQGIGLAVPGVVDRHEGYLRYAPNLQWVDTPLIADLRAALTSTPFRDVPIALRNDADAGALAERTRGAARQVTSAIYLSGDVGIGAGVVLNGRRMADAGGFSGEVGHMVINPQGRVCDCGARGCWETEISIDRLVSPAARVEVLEWLDLGMRNVVNVLNPDVVVLGDHLREFADELNDRRLTGGRLPAMEQVEFRPSMLGKDSTLLGAAEAAFDPFLSQPLGRT